MAVWNRVSSRRLAPLWVAVLALSAGAAWSGKPEWAGQGGGKHERHEERDHERPHKRDRDRYDDDRERERGSLNIGVALNFGDGQRQAVRDYFAPQVRAGKCPPGLAKKGNGCLPPGQAKKWRRGQALPGGVATYPLPRDLEIRLGVPPAGHKYVRVAGDILLIAVGTSMVVDAIEDLAGL